MGCWEARGTVLCWEARGTVLHTTSAPRTLAALRSWSGSWEESRCPAPAPGVLSPSPLPRPLMAAPHLHRGLWVSELLPQIVLTQPKLQSYNIYVPPGDASVVGFYKFPG